MGNLTILGGSGFIGSRLVDRLQELDIEHSSRGRDADLSGRDLGCVVYCIGVTADFRTRPLDAVQAHVCHLVHLLRTARVSSLVYLSSTRLYRRTPSPATEDAPLVLAPGEPDDLYDLSKAMGEAVALAAALPVHVLRLSNVYGTDTMSPAFLPSVIRDALVTGRVAMATSAASVKDYVSVTDVVDVIVRLATVGGRHPVYNVASGTNVTHAEVLDTIVGLTGCQVEWAQAAPTLTPPTISISRVQEELALRPKSILAELPALLESYRREFDGSKQP